MPDRNRTRRAADNMNARLAAAQSEEDFQSVGHLAREVCISVAQVVYHSEKHSTDDDVKPCSTDAKPKLSAYVGVELAGQANVEARRRARASIGLADALTHNRSATRRDASMAVVAVDAIVRIAEILEGETSTISVSWEGVEAGG